MPVIMLSVCESPRLCRMPGTFDKELVAVAVEELGALGGDRWHGQRLAGQKAERSNDGAHGVGLCGRTNAKRWGFCVLRGRRKVQVSSGARVSPRMERRKYGDVPCRNEWNERGGHW